MKRPSLSQTLVSTGFVALSAAYLYLYVELSHVNRDLNATADQNTVPAITQRLDKMQDQMDGFAGGKPFQDADFRASQQALSRSARICRSTLSRQFVLIWSGDLAPVSVMVTFMSAAKSESKRETPASPSAASA